MAEPDDLELISLDEFRIRRGKYCGHTGTVVVCPEERRVACKQCEAPLDPIDALVRIVRSWEAKRSELKRLDAEITARSVALYALKTEERNTRARLRRLGMQEVTDGS